MNQAEFGFPKPTRFVTELNEAYHYPGPVYEPRKDMVRLHEQTARIKDLMLDGEWRSLHEISEETGDPEASISAQLRHLRKPMFGGYTVNKRRRREEGGTWEYQVTG